MGQLAQGHKYKVALAKNTAEETPAAAAEFQIPVYDGLWTPREDRARHEVADGEAFRPGGYKSRGDAGGAITTPAFPDSVGRLTMAHFGGDTVTGAADPYAHASSRSLPLPYHTGWIARPAPDGTFLWERFDDGICKTIEYQWASGVPVRTMTDWIFKKSRGAVAAPAVTKVNKLNNQEEWVHSIGAEILLDIDATPAATRKRNLKSFAARFSYDNAAFEQTDEFSPRYLDLGLWTVGFSGEMLIEDYELYLATFYGAKDAADVDQSPLILTGSVDVTLPVFPDNPDHLLRIEMPALELRLDPPGLDVAGGGLRANVSAEIQQPASGSEATVTVQNARATAY